MTVDEMILRKQELGYSFARLSELSGVPQPTIQKIFNKTTSSPRYDTLRALEKVLAPAGSFVIKEPSAAYASSKGSSEYPRQGTYTIEDYYALPEDVRAELIDGVIYNMAAPTSFHQIIAGEALVQFHIYIRNKQGKCIPLMSPIDVQLDRDERTMVQPDLIVVCNPEIITPKVIFGAPDFVLEVLSPSTRRKDLITKLSKYAEAGVREYWIIDPYGRKVIVYFFDDDDMVPAIYPIDAEIPVNIYHGDLIINLNAILPWLPEKKD